MNRLVFIFLIALLAGCTPKQKAMHLRGTAQGTYFSILYYDRQQRNLKPEIDSLLDAFDQSVSLWVPQSILSRINNNDTSVVADKWFTENFNYSQQVARATQGAFDCTVEPLVDVWGFGFDNPSKVDSASIDSIMQFVNYKKVKLVNNKIIKDDPRLKIDFNAIAQGYSDDVVAEFLEKKGIHNFLIDIGGEVKARGEKPDGTLWKVGIEKPAINKEDDRVLKAIIGLKNKSVATSGNYRKYYEKNGIRYSHTIDPKTGFPVKHSLLSVSVITDNTALADAYATSFMVMGFEKARDFVEHDSTLEAFFIYSDSTGQNKTYRTKGFEKLILEEFK
ncbi:MAG: FAD:protein FMN transferase [Bacteroidetes bacterium]|nr:MAG: FAD:protein FMN transferase [Bacteroidota bacterium]